MKKRLGESDNALFKSLLIDQSNLNISENIIRTYEHAVN